MQITGGERGGRENPKSKDIRNKEMYSDKGNNEHAR